MIDASFKVAGVDGTGQLSLLHSVGWQMITGQSATTKAVAKLDVLYKKSRPSSNVKVKGQGHREQNKISVSAGLQDANPTIRP